MKQMMCLGGRSPCLQRTVPSWLVRFWKVWDAATDADTEEAWQQEVARRIQDLDAGKAQTIPWAEVRRRIAAKLENGR